MITNPIGTASLAKREIFRFLSVSTQSVFPPVLTSTLFIFVFGVALGNRIDFSSTGLTYLTFIVPGLMTMHLISTSYENTSFSLFLGRWHNHIQEILLSPLSYLEMVLGLLAGGVMRGVMVCTGIYLVSLIFGNIPALHPVLLLYFMIMISVIFSCVGMIAALWAEDFNMLNMWNIYIIFPLVLLGGVFHPIHLLPTVVQDISKFNPMFYLVQGMRFSVTGVSDISVLISALVTLGMALLFFLISVWLFKIGYKLRT
ncbi:MAG: ABC transporter permease [Candidatus Omnitrophica bacterium]|nr:ABC transporter permease [Candidatus Omnitrophota bacterium]MCB9722048.1 ABC transporter permease [Candidatus Omnitrophota bacterium]